MNLFTTQVSYCEPMCDCIPCWILSMEEYVIARVKLELQGNALSVRANGTLPTESVRGLTIGSPDVLENSLPLRVREAWPQFISDVVQPELEGDCLVFATFTFKDYRGNAPGVKKGRTAIGSFLGQVDPSPDAYVIVGERGKQNARLHFHGLFRFRNRRDARYGMHTMRQCWRYGHSDVQFCKSALAAVSYLSKYISKGNSFNGVPDDFWIRRSDRVEQLKLSV